MDTTDFIVIGGGVVGLSAAIAMRQRGYRVTVLDKNVLISQLDDPASRVYAVNQASQILFEKLGVWPLIDDTRIAVYERMHIWDKLGKTSIDFDARTMACDRLGVMLEESAIKSALLKQAQILDIELVSNWETQAIENQDQAIVVSSTERAYHAQWLIVADGAHSATRDFLGVTMVSWPYKQKAIVAKVRTEQSHHKTAFQIFHTTGPLAFLPLVRPDESSIVWSITTPQADDLMALSDDIFEERLAMAFEHKLGQVTLLSKRRTFPLHMQHVKRYTGERWVLMGDAAHTIHPLAGLGLNIGLADLAIWLQYFPVHTHRFPTERMLSVYQRQRKHAVWQMILFLQAMHVLFRQSDLPILALRGIGLTLCNRLPFVKRLIMTYATGLA